MCRVRRGAQGTDAAASHRLASGEGGFACFCQDKSRPRDRAQALSLILTLWARSSKEIESRQGEAEGLKRKASAELSPATRASAFFDGPKREPKTPFAGRDPPRYSRGGHLRSTARLKSKAKPDQSNRNIKANDKRCMST